MPSFSSSLNIQLSYEMCNRVGKGHQPLEVQAAKNKRHRPTNPCPPPLLLPTHSHKSLELFGIMRARINEMPSALIRTRKTVIVTKRNIFCFHSLTVSYTVQKQQQRLPMFYPVKFKSKRRLFVSLLFFRSFLPPKNSWNERFLLQLVFRKMVILYHQLLLESRESEAACLLNFRASNKWFSSRLGSRSEN